MCVSVGSNDLGERNGEDGVGRGIALCFDEYSNGGDHGIDIFADGVPVWQRLAPCGNREGCEPVSLFEDSQWVRKSNLSFHFLFLLQWTCDRKGR
eukprot:SAG31_NODE_4757_length_2975_cov_1.244437_2_plen_95_part_00